VQSNRGVFYCIQGGDLGGRHCKGVGEQTRRDLGSKHSKTWRDWKA